MGARGRAISSREYAVAAEPGGGILPACSIYPVKGDRGCSRLGDTWYTGEDGKYSGSL